MYARQVRVAGVGVGIITVFQVFQLNLLYEITRTYLKVTLQDDKTVGNFQSLCGFYQPI